MHNNSHIHGTKLQKLGNIWVTRYRYFHWTFPSATETSRPLKTSLCDCCNTCNVIQNSLLNYRQVGSLSSQHCEISDADAGDISSQWGIDYNGVNICDTCTKHWEIYYIHPQSSGHMLFVDTLCQLSASCLAVCSSGNVWTNKHRQIDHDRITVLDDPVLRLMTQCRMSSANDTVLDFRLSLPLLLARQILYLGLQD